MAWRRPDAIKAVIDAIRPHAPELLFVACDGPRSSNPHDTEQVLCTREVIQREIDWPCHLQTLFSATNLGCKSGPTTAIDWFFSHVEEGIILEDDCVPAHDFLPFCKAMLERYRDDSRIWNISGTTFQLSARRSASTYYFSHYPHTWGWASWRRCWNAYDGSLKKWPAFLEAGLMHSAFSNQREKYYWHQIWKMIHANPAYDAWDYQWFFACISNNGLCIIPNVNLVSNIGFGPDATHTKAPAQPAETGRILVPIIHPSFIIRDHYADDSFVKTYLMPRPSPVTRLRIAWRELSCSRNS
jgi:hypothetical protein